MLPLGIRSRLARSSQSVHSEFARTTQKCHLTVKWYSSLRHPPAFEDCEPRPGLEAGNRGACKPPASADSQGRRIHEQTPNSTYLNHNTWRSANSGYSRVHI